MAARRVRGSWAGDAETSPRSLEDDAAGGKTAAQEEGGLRRPAAGVQGRGPPLSLQVVVRPAVAAASASGRRRVARSVRVRALLFGEASKPSRSFYPAALLAPTSRPDTTAFCSVVGDQPKSVPARHRARYLRPHSTRQRIGTSPRRRSDRATNSAPRNAHGVLRAVVFAHSLA